MAGRRLVTRLIGPRLARRLIPRSLFGRSLLIIILPIALMQLAVVWAFFTAHQDTVTSRLSEGLAGEIASIVTLYSEQPDRLPKIASLAQATVGLSVVYKPGPLPTSDRTSLFKSVDRALRRALDEHLDQAFWFDTTRYPNYVDIRVKVGDGALAFIAPRDRAFATQGHIFILYLFGATLILTAVAVLFIRNQVRAIERLAEAATLFGKGGDISSFKPHGAREVREAAAAFLDMKRNIQRHLEQRTTLLASVSHDLRTPLTRLNLELALADQTARTKAMKRDLAEMEHMIDEYLDFARGEGGEAVERLALIGIVDSVAEGARRGGAKVTVEGDVTLVAPVRPNALRRALANLTGNAAAHAAEVHITVRGDDGVVDIIVDDDGPGIEADRREEAFKPFSRLDESRNQNEKGVGLGLAIARDVARAHGGDLTLGTSPLGGLRATLSLPA
jgi:two-component system, OmpR family, osmolarity sensor histidine kinase EnvZ